MASLEAGIASVNHPHQIRGTHASLSALRCDLSLAGIKKTLAAITATIVGLGIAREIYIFSFGPDTILHRLQPLNLDAEMSAGAWFASLLLLICGVLPALIAVACKSQADRWTRYWFGLAAAFLYLSIDEIAGLHERTGRVFQAIFHQTGDLYFLWTIPMGILVLVFAAVYIRFLLALPRQVAVLLILSGAIFVTGAIGFELAGSYFYRTQGIDAVSYSICVVLEEGMEFIGALLFASTLLDYIKARFGGAAIRLS